MNEILSVIQNASPILAAVILGMLFKLRSQSRDIEQLQKRVDTYDQMHLEATIANINANIEFIKSQIAQLLKK